MSSQQQKVNDPPRIAASLIIWPCGLSKAWTSDVSAPVAFRKAIVRKANKMKGTAQASALSVNEMVAINLIPSKI